MLAKAIHAMHQLICCTELSEMNGENYFKANSNKFLIRIKCAFVKDMAFDAIFL